MTEKTGSLTSTDNATQPKGLMASAANIEALTTALHAHLASVASTTSEIIATVVMTMKQIMADPEAKKEFLAFAKVRKVTLPVPFDPSKGLNDGVNPWLPIVRVFVGEFDTKGVWVPSAYTQKNIPGATRHLFLNSQEEDVDGLLSVLSNFSFKEGKKTLRGIEAAKKLDRNAYGKTRKAVFQSTVQIPREVDKIKPAATFTADLNLFPVDRDGYGIATIRLLGDGTFEVYFGNEVDQDVAEIIARSYEFHKDHLSTRSQATRSVELGEMKAKLLRAKQAV